ncbi:phosphodiester glycosidase family protein [Brachybacterium sp. GPGPB12]|uniref:phosphodiester glycosidase family protein n=1 Tax=Brachybacterium sp. GPGPB12 TaxID=3023517 RepID=UPI0031343199
MVADLEVGDAVDIEIGPDQDVDLGIAGDHQILEGGEVPDMGGDSLVTTSHPRTAVGVSRDGSELFVLVLDGRSTASTGMTLPEMGQILEDMGAHNAVNLDGGGSSALAARTVGSESEAFWNSPSDGVVREVPNALVFYSDAPAEELADVHTTLALEGEDAVFPGLRRSLEATGLAADLSPVMADGAFTAEGAVELEQSDQAGAVVRGTGPGGGAVTYTAAGHEARQEPRVLGEPVGLQVSERSLNLPDAEISRTVALTGYDADGRRARIETADVEATTSDGFEVTDDGLGSWSVRATGEVATGTLTLRAAGLSTTVPLTHGTEEQRGPRLLGPLRLQRRRGSGDRLLRGGRGAGRRGRRADARRAHDVRLHHLLGDPRLLPGRGRAGDGGRLHAGADDGRALRRQRCLAPVAGARRRGHGDEPRRREPGRRGLAERALHGAGGSAATADRRASADHGDPPGGAVHGRHHRREPPRDHHPAGRVARGAADP